eukprot:6213007-Pleurochrysis_carterae.AAC.2
MAFSLRIQNAKYVTLWLGSVILYDSVAPIFQFDPASPFSVIFHNAMGGLAISIFLSISPSHR